jgi:hypothetical protein
MNGASLRVLADIVTEGDAWSVRLHCPAEPDWSWPASDQPARKMRAAVYRKRRLPLPDEGWCSGSSDHGLCCQATAETVTDAVAEVRGRTAAQGGAPLGRLLFAALFGSGAAGWHAVDDVAQRHPQIPVELALRWSLTEDDLSRLPWELLHDERHFLATSFGDTPVAVTRVIKGTHSESAPLTIPPRVLFVIGTAVTDRRVRPGAEMVGLLRAVRESGIRIHHRVLHNASPERLHAAVETFRPDVVHVISHGASGPHGSYLVLESDDPNDPHEEPRYAKQFAEQLTVDGRKPPVVVLSACETGSSQRPGPVVDAPFAVDLVAAGVLVVVAMAGIVTDRACRLFTRRFGRAVAAGASITSATAEARRLAFAGDAPQALDWSLPAVFLADDEEPLTTIQDDARAQLASTWISRYGVELDPVFCGREEILSAFLALLPRIDGARTGWESWRGGSRKSVLAVCVDESASGVGKSRLLQEMARHALLDGHIPILIGTGGDLAPPTSLRTLCTEVAKSNLIVRTALGLPVAQTQAELLANCLVPGSPDMPELDRTAHKFLQLEMPERAARRALALDLTELVNEAHQQYPHLAAACGGAVLLMDNLGRKSEPVLAALIDPILDEYGLGERKPIPVVLMVLVGQESDVRQELRQGRRSDKPWLQVKELAPFDRATGEDLFAYEQVMLHPFLGDKEAGITNVAWAFNREIDDSSRALLAEDWHAVMAGLPIRFTEGPFRILIRVCRTGRLVVSANDEDLMKVRL